MKTIFRNWYDELSQEIKDAHSIRIISPFVSEYFFQRIKNKIEFSKIQLITRFNLVDFSNGVSDLDSLKLLIDNEAVVYGIKDLHAKIYIINNDLAIITSANLTRKGLHTNYECGIKITDIDIIEELINFFEELKTLSESNIFSKEKYEDWKTQIKDTEIVNNPKITLPDYGAIESDKIDNNISYYVKFLGSAEDRVDLNFNIKDEIKRAQCHYACGFSQNKKPRRINDGDQIYFARMTKEPNDYAIFGKAIAIEYVEERDFASKEEIALTPWKKDWPIYLRVRNPEFIEGILANCTLLNSLISELDYQSFESTIRNYNKGKRNINPKRSLSQQPYIKLSTKGAAWVEKQYQIDKKNNGIIQQNFINSLPKSIEIEE